jgi:hypothetical protein
MKEQFDQISTQIHEIRNILGPLDLKLEGLDHQITKSRITFEMKVSEMESKIEENTTRIKRLEVFLNLSPKAEGRPSAPQEKRTSG